VSKAISGSFVAIVTPFHPDETINEEALIEQVERQIASGNNIFCNGTNGEFFAMTSDERLRVIEICVKAARGRVPVLAHIGDISTHTTLELARRAEALGADALSCIVPYFIACTQEEIIGHYERIASGVKVPFYLYNIPGRTGNIIESETAAHLAKHPNIHGIKDSAGTQASVDAFLEVARKQDNFDVLVGPDSLIHYGATHGAVGCVSGLANLLPTSVSGIIAAARRGDVAEGERLQAHVTKLRETLYPLGFPPSMVKWALFLSRERIGRSRMPIALSQDKIDGIKTVLKAIELENLD